MNTAVHYELYHTIIVYEQILLLSIFFFFFVNSNTIIYLYRTRAVVRVNMPRTCNCITCKFARVSSATVAIMTLSFVEPDGS